MAKVYIDNDAEWWREAVQKICIIAECVDVYWDSKSFTPRLKDTKKRGAEALKEFKKHFLMMKGMGITDHHLDAFVEIVRCWRRVLTGRDRVYNAKWLEVLWGKFLRTPPNMEDDVKSIMIKYFKKDDDTEECTYTEEDKIQPPTPYKINIGPEHFTDVGGNIQEISLENIQKDVGHFEAFPKYVDLTCGTNRIISPPKADPTKIDAIALLIKTLELNKADKIQLIQSVLSTI
jgi:hypothetical protein